MILYRADILHLERLPDNSNIQANYEDDIVLDITAGSGTTAIAAINTNRRYIIIDKEEKYAKIAEKRINESLQNRKVITKDLNNLL